MWMWPVCIFKTFFRNYRYKGIKDEQVRRRQCTGTSTKDILGCKNFICEGS